VLIRQNAPVFGASGLETPQPGDWQLNVAVRTLRSDDHYRQDEYQAERDELGTYVINRQNLLDITVGYQATRRVSLAVGVPIVNSSWAVPTPIAPPGPRQEQNGRGLGDISLTGRYIVFDPGRHTRSNVIVGTGVKFPTGNTAYEDSYAFINGQNPGPKAVDQSIQPGDGGWGLLVDGQAFTTVKRTVLFVSGNYLANPRNTNDTPSIIVGLGVGGAPANANRRLNSVPDQYFLRAGMQVPVAKTGLTASLAWRMEGLKRYDLFGRSDGFRRPGYELFIEPGIQYSRGPSVFSVYVPIGYYRNRLPDPYTGALGDATFPDYVVLAGYSYRFSRKRWDPLAPIVPPTSSTPTEKSTTTSAPPAGVSGCL
jgi:hypothetical protein